MKDRTKQQIDVALEMQLTKQDVEKLYKKWPERYRGLAKAFNIPTEESHD